MFEDVQEQRFPDCAFVYLNGHAVGDYGYSDFDHETQEDLENVAQVGRNDLLQVISSDWGRGGWEYNLELPDGSGWRVWNVPEDDLRRG